MLLHPLGFDPRWVDRSALTGQGLYYGTRSEGLPDGVIGLRHHPETSTFFASGAAYDTGHRFDRTWDGEAWPILFGHPDEPDLVASAFFWLSGWQEYTTRSRDLHGRFRHLDSLQHRLGLTTRPVVDAYREMLADMLKACGLSCSRRTWGVASWMLCPTHDVDYLRKWRKGMVYREAVHYFLQNRRRVSWQERGRRLAGFLRQWTAPGDVYRKALVRLLEETAARGGTGTVFLKAGAHGAHDVPYDLADPFLRETIAAMDRQGFEIGLHPSYFADTHALYHADERKRLAETTGYAPGSVRQHYLRYSVPATPRLHDRLGYELDSTLGFAEHEGFRHGTCFPFLLYDVPADRPLSVWEMPLTVMESALFNRRGYSLEEACRATEDILASCRRFGGVAVMLWHNVVWDEMDHPGWGQHFLHTLDRAQNTGAGISSLRDALHAWLQPLCPEPEKIVS